jgi:hypothetical protein
MSHNLEVNVDDKDLFGREALQTQCAQCEKVFPQEEAVVSSIQVGSTVTWVEHFCNTKCADTFWRWKGFHHDEGT